MPRRKKYMTGRIKSFGHDKSKSNEEVGGCDSVVVQAAAGAEDYDAIPVAAASPSTHTSTPADKISVLNKARVTPRQSRATKGHILTATITYLIQRG